MPNATIPIVFEGFTYTRHELAEKLGVEYQFFTVMSKKYDTIEEAVETIKLYTNNGEGYLLPDGSRKTFMELSKEYRITIATIARRIKKYPGNWPAILHKGSLYDYVKISYGIPVELKKHASRKAKPWGLSNRVRTENLQKIPSPTKYEEKYY